MAINRRGYTERAVESGERAAAEVIRELNARALARL